MDLDNYNYTQKQRGGSNPGGPPAVAHPVPVAVPPAPVTVPPAPVAATKAGATAPLVEQLDPVTCVIYNPVTNPSPANPEIQERLVSIVEYEPIGDSSFETQLGDLLSNMESIHIFQRALGTLGNDTVIDFARVSLLLIELTNLVKYIYYKKPIYEHIKEAAVASGTEEKFKNCLDSYLERIKGEFSKTYEKITDCVNILNRELRAVDRDQSSDTGADEEVDKIIKGCLCAEIVDTGKWEKKHGKLRHVLTRKDMTSSEGGGGGGGDGDERRKKVLEFYSYGESFIDRLLKASFGDETSISAPEQIGRLLDRRDLYSYINLYGDLVTGYNIRLSEFIEKIVKADKVYGPYLLSFIISFLEINIVAPGNKKAEATVEEKISSKLKRIEPDYAIRRLIGKYPNEEYKRPDDSQKKFTYNIYVSLLFKLMNIIPEKISIDGLLLKIIRVDEIDDKLLTELSEAQLTKYQHQSLAIKSGRVRPPAEEIDEKSTAEALKKATGDLVVSGLSPGQRQLEMGTTLAIADYIPGTDDWFSNPNSRGESDPTGAAVGALIRAQADQYSTDAGAERGVDAASEVSTLKPDPLIMGAGMIVRVAYEIVKSQLTVFLFSFLGKNVSYIKGLANLLSKRVTGVGEAIRGGMPTLVQRLPQGPANRWEKAPWELASTNVIGYGEYIFGILGIIFTTRPKLAKHIFSIPDTIQTLTKDGNILSLSYWKDIRQQGTSALNLTKTRVENEIDRLYGELFTEEADTDQSDIRDIRERPIGYGTFSQFFTGCNLATPVYIDDITSDGATADHKKFMKKMIQNRFIQRGIISNKLNIIMKDYIDVHMQIYFMNTMYDTMTKNIAQHTSSSSSSSSSLSPLETEKRIIENLLQKSRGVPLIYHIDTDKYKHALDIEDIEDTKNTIYAYFSPVKYTGKRSRDQFEEESTAAASESSEPTTKRSRWLWWSGASTDGETETVEGTEVTTMSTEEQGAVDPDTVMDQSGGANLYNVIHDPMTGGAVDINTQEAKKIILKYLEKLGFFR